MASVQNLVAEINRQLEIYAGAVKEDVDKAAKENAHKGAEKLKQVSPKKSGDYAKSWTVKRVKERYVVHNKDHYRLTHLLEKSHAKKDGGRTTAQPHIKPTEQQMIRDFEADVRKAVEQQ